MHLIGSGVVLSLRGQNGQAVDGRAVIGGAYPPEMAEARPQPVNSGDGVAIRMSRTDAAVQLDDLVYEDGVVVGRACGTGMAGNYIYTRM